MKFILYVCVIAFSLLFFTAPAGLSFAQNPFVTIWKTDNPGTSGTTQILFPASGEFSYSWVDVNNASATGSGTGVDGTTITFPQAGSYEVSVTPTGSTPFHRVGFIQYGVNDKEKLLEMKNWGSVQWSDFQFNGCSNLKVSATDIPDLSNVTALSFAFSHSGIDSIPNINSWDMSQVTDLSNFFASVTGFNQSLSNWEVSNVTNMAFMFDSLPVLISPWTAGM